MPFPTIYYKKLDKTALKPFKTNQSDAGYDIFAHSGPRVIGKMLDNIGSHWESISYIEYGIGLSFEPLDENGYLQIYPRSSISNYNLILANHVPIIDNLYRKEVLLRFRYVPDFSDLTVDNGRVFATINMSKIYKVGDKIAQIIPSIVSSVKFVEMAQLTESSRGGFGSTDKK